MHEFSSVYAYFGFAMPHIRVPPLFHQFLKHYQLTAEPMSVQLERLRIQILDMQGQRIPWNDFCLVAERLLELPASESVAERMISHMAALFHASRFSAQPELIDAQIAVRAQELCNEYRSTAGRDRPCNRIQIHKKLHFLNTYTQLEDESLEIRSSSGIDKWSRYHASIPVKSESFCVHLEK